jgi:hypothetical protein
LLALATLATRLAVAAPVASRLAWEELVHVGTPGVAEPGETGVLRVSLTRPGAEPVGPLTGRLSLVAPGAPGVTLDSDLTSWPDIPPGGRAEDVGALVVSLDPSAPCGVEVAFDLELRDADVPFATVPLLLRVGNALPVPTERSSASFRVSGDQVVVWNGTEYGVAWTVDSGAVRVVWFRRLGPDGSQLGDETFLPTTAGRRDGAPALSWGAGRWMIARPDDVGVRVALLDADGTLLSQQHVVTWVNERETTWRVSADWDGVGWGLAFHSFDWQDGPERLLGFTWVHVLPDGTVDAGPLRFDTSHEVRPSRLPVAWTGSAHAVLAWGSNATLFFLDRLGARVIPERSVPLPGQEPAMAWSGRSLGIAVSDEYHVRYLALDPAGDVLVSPVVVAPAQILGGGIDVARGQRLSLAWDGTGFGISMQSIDGSPSPGEPVSWASFVRVDERGRVRVPLQDISEADPFLPHWSVGAVAAFNPDTGEHAILTIGTDDTERSRLSEGSIDLQRVGLDASCAARPPPGEVSAPASGSPLLVSLVDEGPPWISLDLRFEDLGGEALSYHAYLFGRVSLADGSVPPAEVLCHAVPGEHPALSGDGPGRFRLRAFRQQARDLDPGESIVRYLLVTAANESGEGTGGRDDLGRDRPPVNGCGAER